ncbi:MAG: hypothetical protein KC502_16425 [Myxococcales bacterium]|nr:hypothetical protein [Myxococcales bacterium]
MPTPASTARTSTTQTSTPASTASTVRIRLACVLSLLLFALLSSGSAFAVAPAVAATPSPQSQTPAPLSGEMGVLLRPRLDLTTDHAEWRMQMVRPRMRGKVGKASWFVQTELAGTANVLLDARLRFPLGESVTLTVGRFITPFSRAFLTPVPKLAFPDFASPVGEFRVSRQLGAMLTAKLWGERVRLLGGVFSIDPLAKKLFRPVFMGRATVSLGAGMPADMAPYLAGPSQTGALLGVSAYTRIGERTPIDANAASLVGAEPGDVTIGVDLSVRHGSLACVMEGFARIRTHAEVRRKAATYAQCQASPQGSDWEGGLRATLPDISEPGGVVAEALVTRYMRRQDLKVQLRYRLASGLAGNADPTHQLTLQLQLHTWLTVAGN